MTKLAVYLFKNTGYYKSFRGITEGLLASYFVGTDRLTCGVADNETQI